MDAWDTDDLVAPQGRAKLPSIQASKLPGGVAPCAIPAADWARLVGRLTAAQLGGLRDWVAVMHAFLAAPPEARALVAARLAAEHAGLRGLSLKSLYRKAAAWRRREAERPGRGWEALVPAAAHAAPAGVAANAAFVQFWRGLVLQNQRVSSRAWDKLLARLRAGESIPGVGTWRQLYAAEFPGREAPAVCPYRAGVLLPAGWSKANLMRLLPSKWALTAARQGTLAASALLPSVPRTRAGLLRGQIVEIDDMWHDVKVRAADGAPAERCVELALLDVATGFRSYLLKPIRRRDDGTREVVMARMMPYLIGYWLCVQGYAPQGATVMGEHGTAALDRRLAAAVEAATGGKVRFMAGGKLSKPLAQGLWEGRPRGNFRFKARLEGSHSLLHDLLADVPGQVGKDRDAAPGVTACGRELVKGRRGRFPAVVLAREHNGESLLASRGVAEIASASSDLAKKLADSASDNAIVGSLPPAIVKGADTNVTLNPLAVLNLRPSSEIKFLQPPAYPAQANNEIRRLHDELFDYFGLAADGADPESAAIRRRARMAAVLDALRDLLAALLSVTQANASDALLARVLGRDAALPGIRDDVEASCTLALEVNVDDLIAKNVLEKVQAFGQILGPMDRQRQVDTAPILRAAVRALFPDVGDEALKSLEDSKQADIESEEANFLKIKAGLKPQMDVDGNWDYPARLAFWQRLLQENPAALDDMPPEAQAFAQQWIQALRQQAEQFGPNAELGKTGSPEVAPIGATGSLEA